MPTYKFTLHSGPTFAATDARKLETLCADLCSAGFVVVERQGSGYSSETKPFAVLERAVAHIEPAD
jgi:hypothetical protein